MLPSVPEKPAVSVVIRAYNEARHLPEVFRRLGQQDHPSFEVLLVDSGSTDHTQAIAEMAGARLVHIDKRQFTFGRSLNIGCDAARGDILVFLSGHCYPMHRRWLRYMAEPFNDHHVGLVYGKQRGGTTTKYSEQRHFVSTFPNRSNLDQDGFFCNNANCAIRKAIWRERPYDETLTGLEDLEWAKWLHARGHRIAYTARGGVYHIHEETWPQVFRRYEREAIALKQILPDFTFNLVDFLRLFPQTSFLDLRHAARQRMFTGKAREILAFRFMQYWGTYRGAHYHRKLTRQIKEQFFYPRKT